MKTSKFTYPCIVLNKKTWKNSEGKEFSLVTFYASASDLELWSGVYQAGRDEQGYQRMLKERHANEIRSFLENDGNVIPNSVVIAFNKIQLGEKKTEAANLSIEKEIIPVDANGNEDKNVSISIGNLEVIVHPDCKAHSLGEKEFTQEEIDLITKTKKSAAIIDGQHRVSGGNSSKNSVYFPVTAFLGIDKEDQAFHFIVINGKAKKVSKHDIDAVVPKAVYPGLQQRLFKAGIERDDADIVYALENEDASPFKERIIWGGKVGAKRLITKGGIDKAIEFSKALDEDIKNEFSSQTDLLIAVWTGIKKHTDDFWDSKSVEVHGHTYLNQFIKKCAAIIPALQKTINIAWQSGALKIDENLKKPIESRVADAVYDYIKHLPLEVFYCQYKRASITNEASIIDLANVLSYLIRQKKMVYTGNAAAWFAEPTSKELRKQIKKANKKKKTKSKRS